MARPERPPTQSVVSMAETAVAAFLGAIDAERERPEVAERRVRALQLLARADRAFREQAVYLERVEETARRLGVENAELRRNMNNQVVRLTADVAEARMWARGYAHGKNKVDMTNPPEWLSAPP